MYRLKAFPACFTTISSKHPMDPFVIHTGYITDLICGFLSIDFPLVTFSNFNCPDNTESVLPQEIFNQTQSNSNSILGYRRDLSSSLLLL